jgi:septal ring factor EnvC (AmiA/AmiB activator)
MMIALTGVFGTINAQERSGLSDKALSAQYKHEIDVLNSEIKTIKVKLKADSTNADLQADLTSKQAQVKNLKSKKDVIDKAIKSKDASEKAAKKAEKAQEKAEKAEKAQEKAEKQAANAQKIKESEK